MIVMWWPCHGVAGMIGSLMGFATLAILLLIAVWSAAGGRTAIVASGIGAIVAGGIQGFQEWGPELPF